MPANGFGLRLRSDTAPVMAAEDCRVMPKISHMLERLDSHSIELIKGSMYGFASRILTAAGVLAFNVVLARSLGADDAGVFYLGVAIVSVVSIVSLLGIDNGSVRHAAPLAAKSAWDDLAALYKKAGLIVAMSSLAAAAIIYFSAPWVATGIFSMPELVEPLRYLGWSLPAISLTVLTSRYLQSVKRPAVALFFQSAAVPVVLLLVMLAIPIDWQIDNIIVAYPLSALLALVICLIVWLQCAPILGAAKSRYDLHGLYRSSRALLPANIVNRVVLKWSAVLFLGIWGSTVEIAWFTAARALAALISFAILPVNTMLAPKIAVLAANNENARLFRLAQRATVLIALIALPVVIPIAIAPNWVMSIYGSEFIGSGSFLLVLALGQVINVLTGPVQSVLVMTGNEVAHRKASYIGGAVYLASCVTLIPAYGGMGAAWATMCGVVVTNLVSAAMVWRLSNRLRLQHTGSS